MKISLSIFLFFGLISFLNAQDTIIRLPQGKVKLTQKGIGNTYTIEGNFSNSKFNPGQNELFIKGKVKKIEYEYEFVATYHGSTQPGNPKEFYKPQKRKSHYYVPVSDIIIRNKDSSKIFQTYIADSNILRTYHDNGKLKSIHFFNSKLELDSIHSFYSNGKKQSSHIGNWNPKEGNLKLQLAQTCEMHEINYIEPKVKKEFHGNGSLYIKGIFNQTEEQKVAIEKSDRQAKIYNDFMYYDMNRNYRYSKQWFQLYGYQSTYTFYDTLGNLSSDLYLTSDYKLTGKKYEYFENGKIQTIKQVFRDHPDGIYEFRNEAGFILYRQYYHPGLKGDYEYKSEQNENVKISVYRENWYLDSTVFYKKIKDSLITFKSPTHFVWNNNDNIEKIGIENAVAFEFNSKGEVITYKFNEVSYSNSDKGHSLIHLGEKDKYGLPHGKWIGINQSGDTCYIVHFFHGHLHGKYQTNFENFKQYRRTYHMDMECDSSYESYKGNVNKKIYYSSPGNYAKKMEYYSNGNLHWVDTSYNGKTFIRILQMHYDGWVMEETETDTLLKRKVTRIYSAKNKMEQETVFENYFTTKEIRKYYLETQKLKEHLVFTGYITEPTSNKKNMYDEKGDLVASVFTEKVIQVSVRKTFDENGHLLQEVTLHDGVIVK